jgi:hypothetical protein
MVSVNNTQSTSLAKNARDASGTNHPRCHETGKAPVSRNDKNIGLPCSQSSLALYRLHKKLVILRTKLVLDDKNVSERAKNALEGKMEGGRNV